LPEGKGEVNMDFTPKQLQYLFYIDLYKNSGRLISDLAEQMGVSKAAVSQVLDFQEKSGLIKRGAPGGIALADGAESVVTEVREKYNVIRPFFQKMPNLTEDMAMKCALRYVCWMPRESVEGLVRELLARDRFNRIRWDMHDRMTGIMFPFPNGIYKVPFNVFKQGRDEISMGDKGFVKPAKMVVLDGRGAITLTSREIRHQSKMGKRLRGRLTRLSCLYGDDFVPVKPKNNEYTIPLHYIRKLSRAPDGTLCGTLRIQAEAGKCVASMPVSEADIVFRFVLGAE
jgi:Mn-dependent DtxR family transcriptional regulator